MKSVDHYIWSNTQFRKLFAACFIDSISVWFDIFALQIIFSYDWHVTPLLLSCLFIAYMGPGFLFGQFAGVIVDRYNKKKLATMSLAVCAILTFVLLISPNPYFALVVVLARSCFEVFCSPALQTLLKEIVLENHFFKAVALVTSMSNFSKILSPFLGAVIVAYTKPQVCLALTAVGYLISALMILRIKYHPQQHEWASLNFSQFFKETKEGWSYILHAKTLVISIAIFILALLFVIMLEGQLSIFLREIAFRNSYLLGHVMALSGLGALLIGLYLSRKSQITALPYHFAVSILLLGLGYLGISGYVVIYGSSLFLYFFALIQGVGMGWLVVVYSFILRHFADQKIMGRVVSISASLQSGVMVIGPLLGGVLMSHYEGIKVYSSIGILLIVFSLILTAIGSQLRSMYIEIKV